MTRNNRTRLSSLIQSLTTELYYKLTYYLFDPYEDFFVEIIVSYLIIKQIFPNNEKPPFIGL